MESITTAAGLKKAIQLLEAEQAIKGQLLKEQCYLTFGSLKPLNLLRSTLNDVTSSPYLIENMLGAVMGLATGYFTKKIVVGSSVNIVRKLLGSVMQFGITNLVARHPNAVKSFSQSVFQYIFRKKERKSY
jgi:hypothetical protein